MLGYFQNTSSHNSKMFQISQKPVDATGQMKILTEVHTAQFIVANDGW